MTDTRTKLLGLWRRLAPLPGGPWLFSKRGGVLVATVNVRWRLGLVRPKAG